MQISWQKIEKLWIIFKKKLVGEISGQKKWQVTWQTARQILKTEE